MVESMTSLHGVARACKLRAMLYDGWLSKIAARFQEEFDRIEATHNFEYGTEFEVAVANVLRKILPQRFGVCRGFIVARDGARAGDDIIVFDAQRFPTLRALEGDLARHEAVPAEAVLAYIEAKHSLYAEGDEKAGQSLAKATKQVSEAKSIPRARVPFGLVDGAKLPMTFTAGSGWPNYRNPYYGAIWARNVRAGEQRNTRDAALTVADSLAAFADTRDHFPDAIIAGPLAMFPIDSADRKGIRAFLCETSELVALTPVAPLGFAVAHLCWAISKIQLGELPWPEMLVDLAADETVLHGNPRPIRGRADNPPPPPPPPPGENATANDAKGKSE